MSKQAATAPAKTRGIDAKSAMLKKLQESALSAKDAALLGFVPYSAEQVAAKFTALPAHRAGFYIPYFDLDGKQSKFYRFRYLEYGHSNGFNALVADGLKRLRYGQPEKTLNELYLPPFMNWRDYALAKEKPILITEGELKAACATKMKLPTIGLGGVWCFKSKAAHMHVLPQFQEFIWKERKVYIVYDSDAASNWQVVKAENALARELMLLGAVPYIVRLPALAADSKTGLDDYLVARGASEFYANCLTPAEPWIAAQELYALNEEVVYVDDPGVLLRLDTLQRMTPRAFTDHAYAPRTYWQDQPTLNGTKSVEKSAPKEWLKWPHRATVQRVTYEPGKDRVTNGCLNVWKGWQCAPERGDCAPWTQLLDYLFAGAPPSDRQWFEQWLAYPLQHPGEKLYSASVFWGLHHGTGKSLVGYTMFRIYGSNATEIGDRDLYSTHNEWAEHKQFVMGDEITGGDKRNTADRMKSMITQKQLRLNPKYVPSYTVPDCINYYFTSNHPDAFFLEDTDRRFFIHEVKGRPQDNAFYKRYMDWLNNCAGDRHLFDHLLCLDTKTFDPQGHAPVTASKMEMIDNGRSDVGVWVTMLREDPDRILNIGGKPLPYRLWTTTELHSIYDPQQTSRVTANGLARELRRAGFQKVYSGMPVLTEVSGRQRLWALRDVEKVTAMKHNALAKVYDDERGGKDKSGKKF
jgi:hypothetical protein